MGGTWEGLFSGLLEVPAAAADSSRHCQSGPTRARLHAGMASDCRGDTRKVLIFLAWVSRCLGKERGQQCQVPPKSWAGGGSRKRPSLGSGRTSAASTGLKGRSPTSTQISASSILFPPDVYIELVLVPFLCLKYFLRHKHVKHTTCL